MRLLAVTVSAVLLYLFLRPLLTVVGLFLLGTLLAAVLHLPLTWLQERTRLPRGVAAVALVLLLAALGAAALWWLLPILLGQVVELAEGFPGAYAQVRDTLLRLAQRNPALAEYVRHQVERADLQAMAAQVLMQVGLLGTALVRALLAGLLVLVVALYSLLYPLPLVRGLLILWPPAERQRVAASVQASLHKVRAWAGGMAVAMLAVGVLSMLALRLLGVPYALLFGVIAALLEVVPTLGPILAALLPMAVAFFQEPLRALWVALAFFAIQQVENNLLVPYIFAGALRMHPVLVLFAVLMMGTLFGVLGVFVSIPLLAVVQAVVQEFARPPGGETQAADEQARNALEMPRPPAA
ncbi:MAG: AI-2E family transporter [Armatimonadetes bacterium]|nr:AI-2E family transporter [Armatimonadota bacterium]